MGKNYATSGIKWQCRTLYASDLLLPVIAEDRENYLSERTIFLYGNSPEKIL